MTLQELKQGPDIGYGLCTASEAASDHGVKIYSLYYQLAHVLWSPTGLHESIFTNVHFSRLSSFSSDCARMPG